jgi:DNA-binding transcriptional ArsR family regulator
VSRPARVAPVDEVFFALADPTRVHVVTLLGEQPRRASELAEALGQSRPGMSRHLRILRRAGLLREEGDERDGRARRLVLEPAGLDRVRAFVDEVQGFWSAQLASLKTHAEARAKADREGRAALGAKRRAAS